MQQEIDNYRHEVLEALRESNNHFPTKEINLKVLDKEINYHRWMHPWQGSWEIEALFNEKILTNLSKIIKPGSTVIDIGAQAGNMSVAYSLFAKQVISFEPNPATFEVLEKNSHLNPNIKPFNFAISDEEGALTFHYSDYGFCNGGFATRTSTGIGVTGHTVPIDVMGINLEAFIQSNEIDLGEVSMIKIDAEGHDKDILKTIKGLITKHKPILITEIYNGLTALEVTDLLDTIHSLGYKAYDEEVNRLDLDNLGSEIKSTQDIKPGSGHNLICIHNDFKNI